MSVDTERIQADVARLSAARITLGGQKVAPAIDTLIDHCEQLLAENARLREAMTYASEWDPIKGEVYGSQDVRSFLREVLHDQTFLASRPDEEAS